MMSTQKLIEEIKRRLEKEKFEVVYSGNVIIGGIGKRPALCVRKNGVKILSKKLIEKLMEIVKELGIPLLYQKTSFNYKIILLNEEDVKKIEEYFDIYRTCINKTYALLTPNVTYLKQVNSTQVRILE